MTASDYKNNGFGLSQLIDQAVITRAENDVLAAYIVPMWGRVPTAEEKATEPIKTAIMSLTFLLIQQRNISATRAGAKTKMSEQSNTPTYDDILRQHAPSCVRALQAVNANKEPYEVCSDICRLFFTTNYFYSRN